MRMAEQAEEQRRAAEQAAVSARAAEQARKAALAEERRLKLEAEVQVRFGGAAHRMGLRHKCAVSLSSTPLVSPTAVCDTQCHYAGISAPGRELWARLGHWNSSCVVFRLVWSARGS